MAGRKGESVGSSVHLDLARAQVQAQALELAAGCLGSEVERWSGDAEFSKDRRERKKR